MSQARFFFQMTLSSPWTRQSFSQVHAQKYGSRERHQNSQMSLLRRKKLYCCDITHGVIDARSPTKRAVGRLDQFERFIAFLLSNQPFFLAFRARLWPPPFVLPLSSEIALRSFPNGGGLPHPSPRGKTVSPCPASLLSLSLFLPPDG